MSIGPTESHSQGTLKTNKQRHSSIGRWPVHMMFILPKTKKVEGGGGGGCLPQLWGKVVTNICLTYFHQRQCTMSSDSVSKALQESRYFTAVKREEVTEIKRSQYPRSLTSSQTWWLSVDLQLGLLLLVALLGWEGRDIERLLTRNGHGWVKVDEWSTECIVWGCKSTSKHVITSPLCSTPGLCWFPMTAECWC